MTTYTHHKNRACLGISGPDAGAFLQSTLTQDVESLQKNTLSYAAHLSPQGKMLYDFFIAKTEERYILDCERDDLMPLAKKLHSFVVSKKVVFEDLSDDYSVLTTATPPEDNFVHCMQDNRHTDMGWRIWATTAEYDAVEKDSDTTTYTEKRISLVIPENDGIQNKTLINELNFERIGGVSFNKGCYVGQELTARTKFRTEPKKRLFYVTFETTETLAKGTPIMAETTEVGWLMSNLKGKGIALLRLRYEDKQNLTVEGAPLHIHYRDDTA